MNADNLSQKVMKLDITGSENMPTITVFPFESIIFQKVVSKSKRNSLFPWGLGGSYQNRAFKCGSRIAFYCHTV